MREEMLFKASRMLKTLADPTRLRILLLLGETEMSVKALSAALRMEQSATSHQLAVLKQQRLIRARRAGRQTFYAPCDHHIFSVLRQVQEHVEEEEA